MTETPVLTDLLDAFGARLGVGDEVIYCFTRQSNSVTICRATVVGRTAKKVRIEMGDSRHGGLPAFEPQGCKLVPPHQVVKCSFLPQDTQ